MNIISNKIFVIIPAGGSGQRFSAGQKKQFLLLKGKPILNWSIETFLPLPEVHQIIVAVPQDSYDEFKNKNFDKRLSFVVGGKTRAESVYHGFQNLKSCQPRDVVLIHDAVRPLVSRELILSVAIQVPVRGTVIPALKLTDTVKQVSESSFIQKTLDRNQLYGAQTPQGFLYEKLQKAYQKFGFGNENYTDESLLMEAVGEKVFVCEGERENIKITTQFDLELAEMVSARRPPT